MGLLHCSTLVPTAGIAAIRFPPVRITSITIFPTGTQPFDQCPEIVAQTEPSSFYLDILFNALPVHPSESKEKRFPNELVPTSIAYTGGQLEFAVNLGPDYATRLLIVKGEFQSLSLAVYGDVIADIQPLPEIYQPGTLPMPNPVWLSPAVDPANSSDPTALAKQLLSFIPEPPSLSLVSRLILCLKPYDDEWDMPDFPHLYADLGQYVRDFDLDKALDMIARPIPEVVSEESLTRFAVAVSSAIGTKTESQALDVATILAISASQHPSMALALCQQLDLALVFDEHTMTEAVLLQLLDAAANADIARYLNMDSFLDTLHELQIRPNADKVLQAAARRLEARIRSWDIFEDALSNPQGDFKEASLMLKDIGSEEQALGAWLESMTIHDDLLTKLSENPVSPTPLTPPALFALPNVSHAEFIAFVRAYIGVASVLAVLGWADSLPNDHCRERALAVLRLWQTVEGYSELVHYFFFLPQFSKRLGWIIAGNDPPRKSGVLGEQILSDIVKDPQAMLQPQLVKTVLALESPLTYISESSQLLMRKAAFVVEDGLPAAIEEIAFSSDHPLSLRRLYTLRVSLAIVTRDLSDEDGPWFLAKTSWDEQSLGILPRLTDIFIGVSEDLSAHFVVDAPPPLTKQDVIDQLLCVAAELLPVIPRLRQLLPLTARSLRRLTAAVADVFVCASRVDINFSPTNAISKSACAAKQECFEILRNLSAPEVVVEPDRRGSEVILKTLLGHALQSGQRDPAYHLLQVFRLVDRVIPTLENYSPEAHLDWVTTVLPGLSRNMATFLHSLDPENKLHLMKRLVILDNNVISIAEWLLQEELKHLMQLLALVEMHRETPQYFQVNHSLHFFLSLAEPSSPCFQWFSDIISSESDTSKSLSSCMTSIVNARYISKYFSQLTKHLLSQSATLKNRDLTFSVVLACFHVAQHEPKILSSSLVDSLKRLSGITIDVRLLVTQVGLTLAAIARQDSAVDTDVILPVLTWLMDQGSAYYLLPGITSAELATLYEKLGPSVTDTIQTRLTVDEDVLDLPEMIELPETLTLSIEEMNNFLSPVPEVPSTPKQNCLPDIMNVIISPPAAILRSPAATGLTKTYANNDFRELRQIPSARQNTSRLPSMHVDDFELNASPVLVPISDAFNPFQ